MHVVCIHVHLCMCAHTCVHFSYMCACVRAIQMCMFVSTCVCVSNGCSDAEKQMLTYSRMMLRDSVIDRVLAFSPITIHLP